MTWNEIQNSALHKIFANDSEGKIDEDLAAQYIEAIPAAANEGLMLICTCGEFIRRFIDIDTDELFAEKGFFRVDLADLTDNFYELEQEEVYFLSHTTFNRCTDYLTESESIIYLPKSKKGKWRIYYRVFPPKITVETPKDFALPLSPNAAVILPLYIASQIYKDDDFGIAMQYRNEFDMGLEVLRRSAVRLRGAKASFRSESGWW